MAQMEGGFNLLGKSKSVCMMVDGLEVQKAKKERKKAWLERDCRTATRSVKRGAGKNDRNIRSMRGRDGAMR